MKRFKTYFPPVVTLFGLLLIWQIYTYFGNVKSTILPSPKLVGQALFDYKELILNHALQTSLETLLGFGLAILLGMIVSFAIYFSSNFKKAVYPLLVISQTIPIIALAPLLLIWFGFGIIPKIIIVMLYCFFPIAVSFSEGLLNTPKHLSDYLKSLGANNLQILRYVSIPSSLDYLFSGLKISAVYAVTGAVVGEYVGAFKGLGIYLQTSASSHATAIVFAIILVIIFLSIGLLGLVVLCQKILMPWKNHESQIH